MFNLQQARTELNRFNPFNLLELKSRSKKRCFLCGVNYTGKKEYLIAKVKIEAMHPTLRSDFYNMVIVRTCPTCKIDRAKKPIHLWLKTLQPNTLKNQHRIKRINYILKQ